MDDFLYAVYEEAINNIDLTKYNYLTRPQIWWDIKGLIMPIQLKIDDYSEHEIVLLKSLENKIDTILGLK
jgi:hypothetical protein